MANIKEITDIEQVYFEVQKIKQQVNVLSDFLASRLKHKQQHKPKTAGMIDPRTGKPFREGSK